MKRGKIISITLAILLSLLLFISIVIYKPSIIGELFNKLNMREASTWVYKINYNLTKNHYSLAKLSLNLSFSDNPEQGVLFMEELFEDDAFLRISDKDIIDDIMHQYMYLLFDSGEKDKFRKFYAKNITKFQDDLYKRRTFALIIKNSSVSDIEDYEFALKECKWLLEQEDTLKDDRATMIIYSCISKLYEELGESELSSTYYKLAIELFDESISK